MYTCDVCKAVSPTEQVSAHYGWCSQVGGPGYHPGSIQALQRAVREHQEQMLVEAVADANRRASNNGWVKYPRPATQLPDVTTVERPTFVMAKHHTEERDNGRHGYLAQKPGRELPREWRDLLRPALMEQGVRYFRTGPSGKGKPRIVTPDGQTYVLTNTPSDWRAILNTKADLRKLGVAV